jgi:hypothetical protein
LHDEKRWRSGHYDSVGLTCPEVAQRSNCQTPTLHASQPEKALWILFIS